MKQDSKGSAFGLLFFTFFIWGSIYVAGKLVSEDIPAPLLASLRGVVAVFPLMFMARKHLGVKIHKEDRKWFVVIGFLAYFLSMQMIQLGISLAGSSTASLINAMTPVAVTILAAFILKEPITPVKCTCLALALAGTVVITRGATAEGQLLGIGVVFISVFSFATASVLMRRLTARYPAILVTAYSMAASLVFQIPTAAVSAMTQEVNMTPLGVAVILYLGLIGSGLSQFTWTKCLSMLPAGTCSLFYPLQPVFAALLGAAVLKETFNGSFFIGLFLISLDVVLNTLEASGAFRHRRAAQ